MYQATLGSSKTQYPVAAGGAGPVPALPGFYSAPAPGLDPNLTLLALNTNLW